MVEDEGVELILNNDFCFTEEDFLRASNEMNDATRHQGIYSDTWRKIKNLKDMKKFVNLRPMGAWCGRLYLL